MAYTTPIFDRTQADIDAKTSKAYFNVADWIRIYNNAFEAKGRLETALGTDIPYDFLATPTTTTIPSTTTFNLLLANIERLRVVSEVAGTTEVFAAWVAGANELAPKFTHVNQWEKTIDLIYNAYVAHATLAARRARTGVSQAGSGLTRNNKWRHY